MKKISLCTALVMAVMLTACKNADISPQYDESTYTDIYMRYADGNYPAFTDPEGRQGGGFADIAPEDEDYANIICRTEFESYTADTEFIEINIQNQNAGKGFWFYGIPHLERLENGEWVRLNYYDIHYRNGIEERWWYCGVENRPDMQFSTRIRLTSEYLLDEFTEGEYRAVIYVGNEKIYAPFTVTNAE